MWGPCLGGPKCWSDGSHQEDGEELRNSSISMEAKYWMSMSLEFADF